MSSRFVAAFFLVARWTLLQSTPILQPPAIPRAAASAPTQPPRPHISRPDRREERDPTPLTGDERSHLRLSRPLDLHAGYGSTPLFHGGLRLLRQLQVLLQRREGLLGEGLHLRVLA